MNVKIDISDIKILEEFFQELSTYNKKQVFIAAYRKAVKPLIAAAKASAPMGQGNLQKSIGTMALKNEVALLAGAMRPRGSHGHLLEDGTTMRSYITKKNKVQKSTGRGPATHFFENAYNATEGQIYSTVTEEWHREIENFIRKTNNRLR